MVFKFNVADVNVPVDIASSFLIATMDFIVSTNFPDTVAKLVVCLPDFFDINVIVIFIALFSAIRIYLFKL